MTCTLIHEQLDDYLDGNLADHQEALLARHIGDCVPCQQSVVLARELQEKLVGYGQATMSQPDAAFFDRAMAKAVRSGAHKERKRWVMTGFGGAIAAAFAIWMIGGIFFAAPDTGTAPGGVPAVTMALEEPRTVNLVFASAEALANATMTVVLPQGIEIDGFQGQREITWMTSLKEGKNILPLTLIATSQQGGELLATLRHDEDDRSFRVQVTVI